MTDSPELLLGHLSPARPHPAPSARPDALPRDDDGVPPMGETGPTPSRQRTRRSLGSRIWRESDILDLIRRLTAEKDGLRRSHHGRPMSAADRTRLERFESALDTSWDLVRQRRARLAAGQGWDDLSQRVTELLENHSYR